MVEIRIHKQQLLSAELALVQVALHIPEQVAEQELDGFQGLTVQGQLELMAHSLHL